MGEKCINLLKLWICAESFQMGPAAGMGMCGESRPPQKAECLQDLFLAEAIRETLPCLLQLLVVAYNPWHFWLRVVSLQSLPVLPPCTLCIYISSPLHTKRAVLLDLGPRLIQYKLTLKPGPVRGKGSSTPTNSS